MIALDPIDAPAQRRALSANGGFLWWYADLVNERGDGAVLIWSFGLPFLPDYAQAVRDGRAPRAAERPSLNLAVYRDWSLDCYVLREFEPSEIDWTPGSTTWQFGRNRIESTCSDGERSLRAEVDCRVAGSNERLRGSIEVDGCDPEQLPRSRDAEATHLWNPLAVGGPGRLDLRFGGETTYRFEGEGYHDANAGTEALHELGIEEWYWGRLPLENGVLVFYRLEGDRTNQFALHIDRDGAVRQLDDISIRPGERRRNLGGMPWWNETRIAATGAEAGRDGASERTDTPTFSVRHRGVVDSGPFYMRFMTEVYTKDSARPVGTGMAELIRPDRIDRHRHRPLVRMCVDQRERRNSMWLPLFTGPRRGRLRRLLRYNLGAGGREST